MSSRVLKRFRVAVFDDQPVVRTGLIVRLSSELDMELTGAYASSRALAEGLARCPADVVLLDCMPDPRQLSGFALIRALHARHPQSGILVFSANSKPSVVAEALHCGARGFFSKDRPMDELVNAIRVVSRGAVYAEAGAAGPGDQAAPGGRRASHGAGHPGAALSGREKDVIRCYLGGMTVTEIAAKFNRSVKTVSSQKSSAFRKLGVSSNTELFRIRSELEML